MSFASPSDNLEQNGMMYPIPLRVVQSNLTNNRMSHGPNMPIDLVHSRKKTLASLPDEMLLQTIDLLDSDSLRRFRRESGHIWGLVTLKMLRRVECVEREMMRAEISDTCRFQERVEKFGVQFGRDMTALRMSVRHSTQKLAALV
jgi:hypothetical protein